jgi:O-antigen ligase
MAGHLGLTGAARWRYLWLGYLPLALSAITLSGSRGAALAAACAVAAVLWWMGRQSLPALAATVALLAAGTGIGWASTPQSWERLFTVRQQLAGGTLGERLPIWSAGWDLFLQHPLLGVGVAGFQSAVAHGLGYAMVAHNTPLSVAAEAGLVGLVLFYGAPVTIALATRRAPAAERGLALGLLATWFIGTASLTWEYRKATWLVMLVGAAMCWPGRDQATAGDP